MYIICPDCHKVIEINIPELKEEPCILADSVEEYREAMKRISRNYLHANPLTGAREIYKRCQNPMCINVNHFIWRNRIK